MVSARETLSLFSFSFKTVNKSLMWQVHSLYPKVGHPFHQWQGIQSWEAYKYKPGALFNYNPKLKLFRFFTNFLSVSHTFVSLSGKHKSCLLWSLLRVPFLWINFVSFSHVNMSGINFITSPVTRTQEGKREKISPTNRQFLFKLITVI